MAKQFTEDDDALLAELGVEVDTKTTAARTPRDERVIAGFEEIQRFVEEHGAFPQHGEDRDIFERLYAVRLDRLRELEECRTLLAPLDHQGLLKDAPEPDAPDDDDDDIDDDALLEQLGVEAETAGLTVLRHVRSKADKRVAEEIAERTPCADFEEFRPLFEAVQADLDAGVREARPFMRDTDVSPGQFFILGGQKAYVHGLGPEFKTSEGRPNRRMRVIFDNGVETNALLRSFQRALYKPENRGRRITDPSVGPLFADIESEGDTASGTIYVLRSKSNLPIIADNRDLVHKIGVTRGDVEKRIASARLQPTYLMADVEVVATYDLFNVNRTKLENLIHRIFASARLEIEISDRFGNPVTPREWYLAPLHVIDEVVGHIRDGTITKFEYDPQTAALQNRARAASRGSKSP